MPRVLVAQIGARRGYAVPRGLAAANCLHSFVTDACSAVAPWNYLSRILPRRARPAWIRGALERRIDGVPPDKIHGCFDVALARYMSNVWPLAERARVDAWARQNRQFGKHVVRIDWGTADTVYAFNGAAIEIFRHARERGIRCILDQTAAPWRFNTRLLQSEQAKWPEWETHPADADPTGEMIAREEAEWELADQIVCGSQFVVDAIRSVGGPAGKCRVVAYPVSVTAVPPRAGARAGHPLRVLYVGTLQLRKGIQYFWDAARRLPRSEFEFRAVGPSHLTPSAQALLNRCIHVTGQVERSAVWNHYQWADVLVLPTLSEGSANVCLEAIGAGTRVVTTPAAGLPHGHAEICAAHADAIANTLRAIAARSESFGFNGAPRSARTITEYGRDLRRCCHEAALQSALSA